YVARTPAGSLPPSNAAWACFDEMSWCACLWCWSSDAAGSRAAWSSRRWKRSTSARTSRRSAKRSRVRPCGKATSRTRKPVWLGSSATTKGAYFEPRKFGPPERDMVGIEKYAGSPAGGPLPAAAARAHPGVEADEGAAADRDARRGAGHHVVVAGAVVALVVADRPHHRELVGHGGQARHVLGEVDALDPRGDGLELAAVLRRGRRLGV